VRRATVVRTVLAGAAVAAACLVGAPAGSAPVPSPGTSPADQAAPRPVPTGTVTGTDGRVHMADAEGRAVQHRGFNTGKDMTADVAEITEPLMATAEEAGFDLMRLSWQWHKLEPADDAWDEAYLDQVVAALDLAAAHGVSVVLDNHQDVFGPAFGGNGVPEWATRTDGIVFEPIPPGTPWFVANLHPAVQAAWEHLYEDADLRAEQVESFLHVVRRVAGHPALLGYDLLNEPFGRFREGEQILDAAARVEATQITPMYQRLTDAIRTVDTDSWVFVHPPNVASLGIATRLGAIDDPKVVYFPHFYSTTLESGGAYDPADTFHATWEAAATQYAAEHDVPMMVGEWGLPDPEIGNAGLFVDRSLEVLQRSTSGWTVFTWNTGGGYGVLGPDGALDPTWERLVQAWPRAIAGAPTASSWDAAAATLRLTFTQEAGDDRATEIVVPAALYPDGVEVTASAEAVVEEDLDAGIVRVTFVSGEGEREVCVAPEGADLDCSVLVDPPPVDDPSEPPPTAPPAVPVSGAARFTG
jgi:endoglycosylceramidase